MILHIETNHLIRLNSDIAKKLFGEELKNYRDMLLAIERLGYEPIPKELEKAAEKKLAGKDEAYVSRNSGGKLSRWAAKKRKARRKMAKESRKKNREK